MRITFFDYHGGKLLAMNQFGLSHNNSYRHFSIGIINEKVAELYHKALKIVLRITFPHIKILLMS
jgi:hypothetical protein